MERAAVAEDEAEMPRVTAASAKVLALPGERPQRSPAPGLTLRFRFSAHSAAASLARWIGLLSLLLFFPLR